MLFDTTHRSLLPTFVTVRPAGVWAVSSMAREPSCT